jgi:hypothetical protein
MEQSKHLICGVHITDRLQHAVEVQEILTGYGRYIKTRLGLHDVEADSSSPNGVLLLEFLGEEAKFQEFSLKLAKIDGVEVKQMVFDHP